MQYKYEEDMYYTMLHEVIIQKLKKGEFEFFFNIFFSEIT